MLAPRGAAAGVMVVEPDTYGQKGKVLAHVSADALPAELARLLTDGLARHQQTERTFANHVREGQRNGRRAIGLVSGPVDGPVVAHPLARSLRADAAQPNLKQTLEHGGGTADR